MNHDVKIFHKLTFPLSKKGFTRVGSQSEGKVLILSYTVLKT